MRIEDLDEFQGLTPQMVREWLGSHGWVTVCWVPDDFNVDTVGGRERIQFMSDALIMIALKENRTVQSLLREINPRMRKGMPSAEARSAHDGLWVGHMGGQFPLVAVGYWYDDGRFNTGLMFWDAHKVVDAASLEHPCAFWPCDEHGNKVRWPEKDGVML